MGFHIYNIWDDQSDEVLSRIPDRSSFADLPVFSDRPDSISGKKYQQPCSETVSFPFPSTILLFVLLSSVFLFFHIIGINFFSVIIQSSDHSLQYHSSPSVLLSPVVSLSSLIRSSSALYLFCCFSLRIISAKVSSFPTTVTHFLALVTAV